jgi:hypothetical protein
MLLALVSKLRNTSHRPHRACFPSTVSGAAIVLPGSYLVVPYCDSNAASSKYRLDVRLGSLPGISDGVTQVSLPCRASTTPHLV